MMAMMSSRQRADLRIGVQSQLFVDAETPHVAQIVTLVREEKLFDHVARRGLVGRLRSAQLPVDVHDGLFLRIARILLQRIVYNREIDTRLILLVQQNRLGAALDDLVDMLLLKHRLAVYDHVVALDGDHLARILVHEVLDPCGKHTGCQFAPHGLLQIGLRNFHLVREVEDFEDLLVRFETDRTQQRGNGQFFLAVDVRIHHVVDVRRELDPRSLEGDDAGRIEFRTVRVHALAEEHARRAMQLRNDHALRTVDYERTPFGHIGNRTEINVLNDHSEIFVLIVGAIEFQLGFQRDTVRQAAFEAFFDRITRRIDVVVDEFQNEIVPCICDGKVLLKHFVQPLVFTVFGCCVHLEKVPE